MEPRSSDSEDRRWPRLIALGLAIVVIVNVVFAYLAVHGADTVVGSYNAEAR